MDRVERRGAAESDAPDRPIPWRAVAFWILVGIACLPVTGFLAIGLGARGVGYGSFSIPAASMLPTLEIGDHVMAAPFAGPNSLRRGDIVFFRLPQDPAIIYVKRVIGLPGDTIQLTKGVVLINGEPVPTDEDGSYRSPSATGGPQVCDRALSSETECVKRLLRETTPNSSGVSLRYWVLDADANQGGFDNTREFTTPENYLFVLGDNRDNSRDSRSFNGPSFVPIDNVLYRNGFIWYANAGGLARWLSSIAPDEIEPNP